MVITNVLLAALLVSVLATWLTVAIFIVRVRAKARSIEQTIRDFLTQPDAATPSPLAQTVDQIAQLCGRAVIAQAKATFMGEASAVSKAAAKAEQAQAMAQAPGWLGLIASIAPGFSKSLLKNPALLSGLAGLVNKQGSGTQQGNGHRDDVQVPLRLDLGGGH